jgi:uncharacterized protein (DUF362 family)
MPFISRRHLLLASAGTLGFTGCSRRPAARPLVSVTLASAYTQELYDSFRRILSEHKVQVRGKRVVLKPNLVDYDAAAPINTHPLVVHAAMEAFSALGAAEVRIAEGPGLRRDTLELAEAAGYFQTIPGFERIFTDLNIDETSLVRLKRPNSPLESLYLPRTALGADLLVSLPKMKTHHWAVATLGIKNLFGLVPGGIYGWPKNILHWAGIHEAAADLHRVFPRSFTIVDGIVGMQGNGPLQGRPKAAGVIVAGQDTVAVDATCCRIMGIDPQMVRYLRLAETNDQTGEEWVRQIGEAPARVRTDFELLSVFSEYRLRRG